MSNQNPGDALADTSEKGQGVASEDKDQEVLEVDSPIQTVPTTSASSTLFSSITALLTEVQQSGVGQVEDLDEGILLHFDALELLLTPLSDQCASLTNRANALWTQFNQSGRHEDLEDAISLHRDALQLVPAPHPLRSNSLHNFAVALWTRFGLSGQQDDLETAISLNREVLKVLAGSHPYRYASLNNLAEALRTRFEQSGERDFLEEAISLHRDALGVLPASHPDRPMTLVNLAIAIWTQFGQSGKREDLDESISLHRDALVLLPALHPQRSLPLSGLATALYTRFGQSGQPEYLEEAITLHRDALELLPAPHIHRSTSLNNLAISLVTRFEYLSRHEGDLEEAISLYRDVLELLPASHLNRSVPLNNLALALQTRFEQLRRREDAEEAISFHQDVLRLLPTSHPSRPTSLHNLALALKIQFQQSGKWEDLQSAVDACYQSFNSLVSGHPSSSLVSCNLGNSLVLAYFHTQETEYLQKAMDAFHIAAACEAAPASERFRAAREWASHADSRHDSALEAYHAAIQLLPRLAMLGLDLPSRQKALTTGSDGLARDAAACAIRSGQYGKAVELLEEGRAVFWSQALQLRTPMSDLREVAPELEGRLRGIALALEQGSLRDISGKMSDNFQRVMSMEQEASHFQRLNDEWVEALEDVRKLEGFENFLRPRRLSTLLDAAAQSPVVILNASNTGCAALILISTRVQHVPLVLTFADVTALVNLIQIATVSGSRDPSYSASIRAYVEGLLQQAFLSSTLQLLEQTLESRDMTRVAMGGPSEEGDIRKVLAVLWESVVKPVIRSLDLEKSAVTPNLQWCTTGPFSFLPIHAAGTYNTEESECVSDYAVSSYTPTISALLNDTPLPSSPFKMMVAIQPKTPGQRSLPRTVDELERIKARVPTKGLVELVSGTVQDVISHLPATSIAHFACHGEQHAQNPLESALILQDGPLKVSQIMEQSNSNAGLAVLNACQTAKGDENLPDEVIHLASTLLFAGFRGVVATMWNILDEDGPKVADAFYEALFPESNSTTPDTYRPDTTDAPRALHVAVAKLRSEGVSFKRWVPFIYMGR